MIKEPFRRSGLVLAALSTLLIISPGCGKNLQKETIVFKSDFSDENYDKHIPNALISHYNGSKILGRYNTGGFDLYLTSLPEHDLIQVSFDLFLHDNWMGNSSSGIKDSSDIWIMNFDGNNEKYTTFSNAICETNDCYFQSYPNNYPFVNNPSKANAIETDLPGACSLKEISGGTTKYHIQRTTYHTSNNFHLGCYAQLFAHRDSLDPQCEVSWSVDNLTVKVIQFGK